MKVRFADTAPAAGSVLAVSAIEGGKLLPAAAAADKAADGAITKAMKSARFTGAKGQMLEFPALAGSDASRVLLVGLGKPDAINALGAEAAGGAIAARYLTSGETSVTLSLDLPEGAGIGEAEFAVHAALAAVLRSQRFDAYRTTLKADQKPSLASITVVTKAAAAARKAWGPAEAVAAGVKLTKDLVTEPPNVLYPESFAKRCLDLKKLGVKVEVLGEAQMKKLGMGSLLGVGQGSEKESQLVVMQWNGGGKKPPIALVGKGVTFDSGGISLKPGDGMWDMKWDMGGAGAVTGAMAALAGRKAKANVVGVIGLVENMPDGNAQRPADIVTSMSGQTIEVWNTDAEGRLVLADALWYTQDRFKPSYMVNLATLTGAIMIALGTDHAGLFSNDDKLADAILAAGKATGEELWRMPLVESLDRALDSACADMKNITGARNGGSIVGAMFLQRFVNKTKWAHLDIAGTVWSSKAKATHGEGATGYGVRLLDRLVADLAEA
jgi:leucyl aminopeptidase